MPLHENSSHELAVRASRGDAEAKEELLIEVLPSLRAYLSLRAGGLVLAHESSSDLVQSVCREVLADIDGIEFRGPSEFRSWIFQQAWRKAISKGRYWSAAKRNPGQEHAEDPELLEGLRGIGEGFVHSITPSREAISREELRKVLEGFDALSEDTREAILMHRFAGLSHAEIGEQLGKSEGAVRTMVYRGLARLSDFLED